MERYTVAMVQYSVTCNKKKKNLNGELCTLSSKLAAACKVWGNPWGIPHQQLCYKLVTSFVLTPKPSLPPILIVCSKQKL